MNDVKDSVITCAETKKQLELLEQSLSSILWISSNVRETLVKMEANHELDNSELVKEWQQTYASYRDWLQKNPNLALAEKWRDRAKAIESLRMENYAYSTQKDFLSEMLTLKHCADELEELTNFR